MEHHRVDPSHKTPPKLDLEAPELYHIHAGSSAIGI